jgi:hypothetical protein
MFLVGVEALSAVFTAIFLLAYLGGLPTTAVLHSLDVFRYPLFGLGAVLLVLICGAALVAALKRR